LDTYTKTYKVQKKPYSSLLPRVPRRIQEVPKRRFQEEDIVELITCIIFII
jgi:hypothetical protein